LLDHAGIRCRYNEVKKRVEIDIPDHRGTVDNQDNVSITHIISTAAKIGMPTGLIPEYVNAVADRNAYNPAADWIDSREWDGQDRFPAFLATVTTHPDYPTALKEALIRKWLRSAAAAAVIRGYKGRGVLTLQGQQGMGKTSWVKALVSDRALADSVVKLGHHLDAGNKDSQLGAISNWIVEIGELDSSFKRDIARLKGFLTDDSDRVRRPYDRRESEFPRRTVFLATVNEANFLIDQTGNSRWWTIAVEALDHRHVIDMQQVFAQMAAEVRAGAEWWLTGSEEAMLAEWNSRHMMVSAVEELLIEQLDLDRVGEPGLPAMTASETLKLLGWERPTNPQARECGAVLRRMLGAPKRVQGADRWRVPVRIGTAADLNVSGRKVVVGADPGEIY
jgi:predicted P-loop ATPase